MATRKERKDAMREAQASVIRESLDDLCSEVITRLFNKRSSQTRTLAKETLKLAMAIFVNDPLLDTQIDSKYTDTGLSRVRYETTGDDAYKTRVLESYTSWSENVRERWHEISEAMSARGLVPELNTLWMQNLVAYVLLANTYGREKILESS